MSPSEIFDTEMGDLVRELKAKQQPFAYATVVRTAGSTAAKPGAKAVLSADGTLLHGWLGGGCTRGAVMKSAIGAIQSGTPQLVSVTPEELLNEMGVAAGDEVDGKKYARNGCPSKGTVDIFIEPFLPMPELVILGSSPVAQALRALAPPLHWSVSETLTDRISPSQERVIVISTQGQGDVDALKSALSSDAEFIAFVGSAKKYAALSKALQAAGIEEKKISAVHAPAGLNIGAITPEEIALSILAELVQYRRNAQSEVSDA